MDELESVLHRGTHRGGGEPLQGDCSEAMLAPPLATITDCVPARLTGVPTWWSASRGPFEPELA